MTTISDGFKILDTAYEKLRCFQGITIKFIETESKIIQDTLEQLSIDLEKLRIQTSKEDWLNFIKIAERHSLVSIIHEDPFMKRAFDKPRGYSGDAVMLDYVYGLGEMKTTPLGEQVNIFNRRASGCTGVIRRAQRIGLEIDNLVEKKPEARILSIAGGHSREPTTSLAFRNKKIGELVVIDQDEASLAEVKKCYSENNVITVHLPIKHMILGNLNNLGQFDFIYASGLFDYLEDVEAKKLIQVMFNLLKPGGKLMVTNFSPYTQMRAFMEIFCHWHLIYRDMQDLENLCITYNANQIATKKVYSDETKNIVFIEMKKLLFDKQIFFYKKPNVLSIFDETTLQQENANFLRAKL